MEPTTDPSALPGYALGLLIVLVLGAFVYWVIKRGPTRPRDMGTAPAVGPDLDRATRLRTVNPDGERATAPPI